MLLFQGQISPEEAQISGPVGIAQMIGGAMSASLDGGLIFPILYLSAVLSAALAIMNLLPLPALDGGRLLFILIETVRGRRVSPEREGMIPHDRLHAAAGVDADYHRASISVRRPRSSTGPG
jgi:regulator of sigma E protease